MSNRRMNVKRHMAKVIAMLMCFVIFTTSVDITAFAFTSDGDSDKVIVRIDSLSDEIANQKVKTDATLDDISLPASLDVHVTYQTEKEVVDEDEDTIEPSTEAVSQEESQVESTTDDELTEEEDSNDAQDEGAESESDEEQITEVAGANYDSIVTAYVPMKYYAAEPSENDATVETLEEADSQAEAKDEIITEEVTEDTSVAVTWSVDEENSDKAEFKDLKVGEKYIFVPTITEDGYTLDDDIELPTIEVTVDEKVPAFEKSVTVDGVVITVTADDGVFPDDATIEVRKVTTSEENEAAEAIDEVRDDAKNVALSYTFDITVYDKDGNEIEPDTEKGSVKVTFKMAEIANENLETDVYHLEETGGGLNAENLDVNTEDGEEDEAVVETTGFSFYTVEFTYNELQYVLEGDERVELSAILDAVGIKENGEISKVEGSNDKLFKPVFEENVWYIEAVKAFSSEEWLKVTIDEIEYEIVVTDSNDNVTSWAELQTALSGEDGTITLGADINAVLGSATLQVSGTKTLDLNGHVINGTRENSTSVGSVIKVSSGATLTLKDDSAGKTGKITGGNSTSNGGGVYVDGGTFDMSGGTISENTARIAGGVYIDNSGTFKMSGGNITKNTTTNDGAGVYVNTGGSFSMEGGTISDNKAVANGGGVFINNANLTMSGGKISSNFGAYGGGVCGLNNTDPKTKFTMIGGEISENSATNGGGVHLNGVAFEMSNGTISENNAKYGGGVHLNGVTCTMNGGTISNNTAKVNSTDAGGGIYVDSSSFTMNNGSISNNKASGGHGGGIFITSGSTFTLGDGEIVGNWALSWAGGVCNKGTFIMNGGAISNNQAKNNSGGGVSSSGTVTMTGGSINGNTAKVNGGGFYNGGILTLGGAAQITGNVIGGEIKNGVLTGGTANNVYHENGKTISIVEGDKEPTESMNIGITLQSGTGNVTAVSSNTENYVGYFNADNVNYAVVKDTTNKNIKIIDASSYVAVINETGTLYTTVQDAINAATAGQTIKMIKDSNENVAVNKSIILDLNGKVLKGTGSGSVVTISNNANLTLKDSNDKATHTGSFSTLPAGGVITGGQNTHGGGVLILSGTFVMNAGTICKNTATNSGGGVCVGKSDNNDQSVVESHFIMNGGTISDNEGTSWGGGVCVGPGKNKKADFVMNGGTVTKNKSKDGGGVHVGGPGSYSVFTMVDGTISENVVSNGGGGGGISLYFYQGGSNYAFNMLGGTVSNNTTSSGVGGGVKVVSSGEGTRDIAFGGTAKITGNKKGDANNNLYLPNGKTITVATGTDVPATGMKIGVTTQTAPTTAAPVQVSGTNSTDYSSYFISDDPDYSVKTDSNVLKLMRNVATVTTAPQAKTSLKYNASAQSLVTAGVAEHGTMKYALGTDGTTAPTTWGNDIPTGTAVGTYYVWYKSAGDTNYADSTPLCVSVTVAKGTHTVTAPTALNPVYSGEEQALISAGSCTTGTIKYSFDGGNTYTESIDSIKATEIGSYTVYYKVEGDSNYENYGPMQLTAKIVKKSEPAPKPDPTPTPEPDDPDPQPVTPTVRYAETGKPVKNYVVNNSTGSKTPLPYITTDGSKAGWKTIDEALDAHKAKYKKKAVGTLSVTMNGSATVDPKLITDAHEMKIPLSFVLDDEVTVGVPIANTVLSEQVKAGTTPYFSVSSMTTAEAKSVKKAHAGLSPSDITAIGGDENTPVVLILCSNSENNGKKSQLITITFDAAKAGYKKGDMVYLYCGTSVEGIAMYKIGKVDRNGFVTFSVPMVNSYWTIGSVNMKNRLLRKNITMSR